MADDTKTFVVLGKELLAFTVPIWLIRDLNREQPRSNDASRA